MMDDGGFTLTLEIDPFGTEIHYFNAHAPPFRLFLSLDVELAAHLNSRGCCSPFAPTTSGVWMVRVL